MKTLPLSEVKMKLSKLIDRVTASDEEIVITRNGRPTAVIVSTDEFESLKETAEILSDKDFMKEIKKGIRDLKNKPKLYTLQELFEK
ncbi:MAG: prevent-host-death protein [Candidatus Schekmanbacteria bacterium RBG_16_38_10]|uniref:Antitoxin n=1 Tax=Candidatus Schekmanbacteria bacterium RBG_16_38_10 TaxID=1817879 RepID=A0A1F7RWB8_9BACT|nr:MAG: prevent-host-death protein [Candidatus Schekmanbacteria bacterium RBG_16_38_10]